MSVYTSIGKKDILVFLNKYNIGDYISLEGISEGITNSNFFLTTSTGKYILTIFEKLKFDEIPFFLELMLYLNENKIACPSPMVRTDHLLHGLLCDKPATIITCLEGKEVTEPTTLECFNVGKMLAKMHLTTINFQYKMKNPRYYDWWNGAFLKLKDKISSEEKILLEKELLFLNEHRNKTLPSGIIHADLFKDNVLINNNEVGGFIDFYYACSGYFIYDIAIALNDWARNNHDEIIDKLKNAFLEGYQSVRKIQKCELDYLKIAFREAAIRFWVSRLIDYHYPQIGEITYIKDPDVFKKLLIFHQQHDY